MYVLFLSLLPSINYQHQQARDPYLVSKLPQTMCSFVPTQNIHESYKQLGLIGHFVIFLAFKSVRTILMLFTHIHLS